MQIMLPDFYYSNTNSNINTMLHASARKLNVKENKARPNNFQCLQGRLIVNTYTAFKTIIW